MVPHVPLAKQVPLARQSTIHCEIKQRTLTHGSVVCLQHMTWKLHFDLNVPLQDCLVKDRA